MLGREAYKRRLPGPAPALEPDRRAENGARRRVREPVRAGRFQRARRWRWLGLRHPTVVQIHDVGDSDGRLYYTMEFVDGGSLAEQLSGTPVPASQAALLVATLASAVEAAHKGGIIHRDLKPSNVLLADGTPKVADSGLALRQEGGATLYTERRRGWATPSYMAPEQARGLTHALGPGLDIYALGAILYELLTGRPQRSPQGRRRPRQTPRSSSRSPYRRRGSTRRFQPTWKRSV